MSKIRRKKKGLVKTAPESLYAFFSWLAIAYGELAFKWWKETGEDLFIKYAKKKGLDCIKTSSFEDIKEAYNAKT